jgi:hypothetical protein
VTRSQPGLQTDAMYVLARVQLARRELQSALELAGEAHRRINEGMPVEEWSEAIRLCFIDTLLAMGETRAAEEAIAIAFQALQAKAASIGRPEFVRSFLTRNDEVAQLLYHAESRLGLRYPVP